MHLYLEIAEQTLFLDHLRLLVAGTAIRVMEDLAGQGVAFSQLTRLVLEQQVREITAHLVR
jgi:hypothetical protein